MNDLTPAELICLKMCMVYRTRASQLADNLSNCGRREFMSKLGWSRDQVDALMKSLTSKGMGYGDGHEGTSQVFWPSKLGVNTIFDYMEGKTV